MGKPIVAVGLGGVIVSNEPFRRMHEFGMNELSVLSGMPELKEKMNSSDYFVYVKKALEKVYFDLSMEKAISKRRKQFCRRVVDLINENHGFIRRDIIRFLRGLKDKYRIVIVTTFLDEFVREILKKAEIDDIFDYVSATAEEEEDEREIVWERLISGFGLPKKMIGSIKSGKICDKFGIDLIEFDCDGDSVEKLEKRL